MNGRWVKIFQIAVTYIGTVVGAGFASGQSIMQFFTVYGTVGGAGIVVSTFLFMWLGTKMMLYAHRIQAFSYQEFNDHLFGRMFGRIANFLTLLILLGVTAVMLSGTGSIFAEQLQLPYQLGIVISIGLGYLVMTKEMNGIVVVNALVVPMILLFTSLIAFRAVEPGGILSMNDWQIRQVQDFNWVLSPFTYAALNFAFIQAVMVPLGSEAKDESILKWGGIWGGIGLGAMLLIYHFAMNSRMPEMLGFDIPMAEIVRDLGPFLHVLFLLVIYGEIFTTLIGNVFGVTRQLQSLYRLPKNATLLGVLLACFLISQAGFASLLTYLYPLFGYIGMLLLVLLAFRKLPGR
ncbi:YkvI family membrane protein [Paenibacillus macerans]|uniref:YkvI family membrane protein n=1 Tax=Paenibacillus macerans TaxID=44252 RepID=UPI003D31FEF1